MGPTLIDEIVAQVVARVQERMITAVPTRHALMLFSGASTGYVVGMEAIRLLTRANHKLTIAMTASAVHVIGEENVRKAGATDLILPGAWANTPGLVRDIDCVLMPTLSMNTAAKLAVGLMDSLMTTLVLGALLANKPVIAIRDGADPYGNGGLVFSDTNQGAPALRARLAGHLDCLTDFGIQLVPEKAFLATLVQQLQAPAADTPPPAKRTDSIVGSHTARLHTPIVTESDVVTVQPGSTVVLDAGARVTPLAQDTAQRRHLTLTYQA